MKLFLWTTQLETGTREIDEQHRHLFELTNALAEAVQSGGSIPEAAALIAELKAYAANHFQQEEQLLALSTMSEVKKCAHLSAHRAFVANFTDISSRLNLSEAEAVNEILDFLVNWLVTHILKMDHHLARTLPGVMPLGRVDYSELPVERILLSALAETERRFRVIAEEAPAFIWFCGLSGRPDFLNGSWLNFLGLTGKKPTEIDWLEIIHPDDWPNYTRFLMRCIDEKRRDRFEYRVKSVNGEWAWVLEHVVPRLDGDECCGLIAVAVDISVVKTSEALLTSMGDILKQEVAERTRELETMANRDPLTGLSNRRAFEQCLSTEIELARSKHYPLSIIYFDVDYFKNINDDYGHAAGDQVLQRLAQVIDARLRTSDLFCRIGGDEFVIALPHTDACGGRQLAVRLGTIVSELAFDTVPQSVTVSFGVVALEDGDDISRVIDRADRAMLAFKRARHAWPSLSGNDGEISDDV